MKVLIKVIIRKKGSYREIRVFMLIKIIIKKIIRLIKMIWVILV